MEFLSLHIILGAGYLEKFVDLMSVLFQTKTILGEKLLES